MAAAVERIVVQATARDKEAIVAKARKLALPISELMRRGAFAYQSGESDVELSALADSAKTAAHRAGRAIDDAIAGCAELQDSVELGAREIGVRVGRTHCREASVAGRIRKSGRYQGRAEGLLAHATGLCAGRLTSGNDCARASLPSPLLTEAFARSRLRVVSGAGSHEQNYS